MMGLLQEFEAVKAELESIKDELAQFRMVLGITTGFKTETQGLEVRTTYETPVLEESGNLNLSVSAKQTKLESSNEEPSKYEKMDTVIKSFHDQYPKFDSHQLKAKLKVNGYNVSVYQIRRQFPDLDKGTYVNKAEEIPEGLNELILENEQNMSAKQILDLIRDTYGIEWNTQKLYNHKYKIKRQIARDEKRHEESPEEEPYGEEVKEGDPFPQPTPYIRKTDGTLEKVTEERTLEEDILSRIKKDAPKTMTREEINQYIRANSEDKDSEQMQDELYEKFNVKLSRQQISAIMYAKTAQAIKQAVTKEEGDDEEVTDFSDKEIKEEIEKIIKDNILKSPRYIAQLIRKQLGQRISEDEVSELRAKLDKRKAFIEDDSDDTDFGMEIDSIED